MSNMVDPICGEMIKSMGKIFVDDTNLLTFLLNEYNIKVVLKQEQNNLEKWLQLLNAMTGGALNPTKCYCYMISYAFRKGVWGYNSNVSTYKMSIPLPDGSREEIAQLPVSEAKKMLGVWLSPNESDAKHLQEVVVGKTRAWVNLLRNAHL
jgi:hypothetical protein